MIATDKSIIITLIVLDDAYNGFINVRIKWYSLSNSCVLRISCAFVVTIFRYLPHSRIKRRDSQPINQPSYRYFKDFSMCNFHACLRARPRDYTDSRFFKQFAYCSSFDPGFHEHITYIFMSVNHRIKCIVDRCRLRIVEVIWKFSNFCFIKLILCNFL